MISTELFAMGFPVRSGQSIPDAFVENASNTVKHIQQASTNLKDMGDILGQVGNFVAHPIGSLDSLLQYTCKNGLPIFTAAALISVLVYMTGMKAGKKGISVSVYGFLILECVGACSRGVH